MFHYLGILSFVSYGEFGTLYGKPEMNQVVDVKAISIRKNPLFLTVPPKYIMGLICMHDARIMRKIGIAYVGIVLSDFIETF